MQRYYALLMCEEWDLKLLMSYREITLHLPDYVHLKICFFMYHENLLRLLHLLILVISKNGCLQASVSS